MKRRYLIAVAALALLLSAMALGACGGSDDSAESESNAENADGAFIIDMSEHHQSAIAMAEIALERAEHPEVKQLAQNIIASQGSEIEQMDEIHQRLFGEPVDGGSASAGGMNADVGELATAKPFDREFIDMMIPHHQEAITMARGEIADGEDEELMTLASEIIAAQSTEIEEMNAWREQWYGAPSPAGGVPSEEESTSGSGAGSGSGDQTTDPMESKGH